MNTTPHKTRGGGPGGTPAARNKVSTARESWPGRTPTPNVAIVHDWLIGGGAEHVVAALHDMYPDAPIYTSYCTDEWRKKLHGKVVTGFLQHWPFSALRKFLPVLRIWWFTHLDFSSYDLVISSSGNGEAFGIKTPKKTLHINYCHTPTHFYWRHYDQYLRNPGFGVFNPLVRLGLRILVGPLRRWDLKASKRPDYFIANSTHIQKDIKTYYHRDSVVIHPPVDLSQFSHLKQQKRTGFIVSGRHVPQKQHALAVAACTKLQLPLTVVGKGPETEHLREIAGPTITFAGWVSDQKLAELLCQTEGYIFPAFDDFGLAPIAALAAGTPIIAYKAGGALDYVHEGKTGIFFEQQTVKSLTGALKAFRSDKFNHQAIKTEAKMFSKEVFVQKMQKFITKALAEKSYE